MTLQPPLPSPPGLACAAPGRFASIVAPMGDAVSLMLKGAALGVLVAAPVGPMSLLCMRRALEQGWGAGLLSGLGIALADGFYAACAAFGVAFVSAALSVARTPLHLVGGAALCLLGLTMLRAPVPATTPRATAASPLATFATTFALTIVNPATILSFAGLYAGAVSLAGGLRPAAAALLVAGTFLGSLGWWTLLSGVIASTRHLLSEKATRLVRVASSLCLVAFGAAAFVTR
ncbi:LysE family translocator [bacterium]|nr:MAG: LysE family translocator [bacterium]